MKKRYWFVRKRYGWGWTPATWQGWLCVALYLVFFIGYFIVNDQFGRYPNQVSSDMIPLWIATLVLLAISYLKGEPPRWQWGKK